MRPRCSTESPSGGFPVEIHGGGPLPAGRCGSRRRWRQTRVRDRAIPAPRRIVTTHNAIESFLKKKQTRSGRGTFHVGHDLLRRARRSCGATTLRVLKFGRLQHECATGPYGHTDTQFFWDGLREGRLLIALCPMRRLRHRRGDVPVVATRGQRCRRGERPGLGVQLVMRSTRRTVHRRPLRRGPRRTRGRGADRANLRHVDPDDVTIGMAVEVAFETFDGDVVLHQFRRRALVTVPQAGDALPSWRSHSRLHALWRRHRHS